MSDVQQDLKKATIELGKRLGLNLTDAGVSNLQDRWRRHLKQQEKEATGRELFLAQEVLQQIRYGENPVQKIIAEALTGKDDPVRKKAEDQLRWISELPDVRSTGEPARKPSFDAPVFK